MLGRGSGPTLGAAMVAAFTDVPGSRVRPARSTKAKLGQLTRSRRGRDALDDAGPRVTRRTLLAWLAGTRSPNKANAAAVDRAYSQYSQWPRVATATGVITGWIKVSNDTRHRTIHIDHKRGSWTNLDREWRKSRPNPDEIELLYIIDVILRDLTDHLSFPGEGPDGSPSPYEFELI